MGVSLHACMHAYSVCWVIWGKYKIICFLWSSVKQPWCYLSLSSSSHCIVLPPCSLIGDSSLLFCLSPLSACILLFSEGNSISLLFPDSSDFPLPQLLAPPSPFKVISVVSSIISLQFDDFSTPNLQLPLNSNSWLYTWPTGTSGKLPSQLPWCYHSLPSISWLTLNFFKAFSMDVLGRTIFNLLLKAIHFSTEMRYSYPKSVELILKYWLQPTSSMLLQGLSVELQLNNQTPLCNKAYPSNCLSSSNSAEHLTHSVNLFKGILSYVSVVTSSDHSLLLRRTKKKGSHPCDCEHRTQHFCS